MHVYLGLPLVDLSARTAIACTLLCLPRKRDVPSYKFLIKIHFTDFNLFELLSSGICIPLLKYILEKVYINYCLFVLCNSMG